MEIQKDRWLSAIFGYGVFKIHLAPVSVTGEHNASDICDLILRHARQQAVVMYYTKVDTGQVDLVRKLSSIGLYVVDVNVTFSMTTNPQLNPCKPDGGSRFSIREIGPEKHQEVLDIAASCFQYSRFHLDPLIPNAIANRIKHDWVLNYLRKQRGERLWVGFIDEHPVGFLAVLASESNGKHVRTIDLIGVSKAFQKQGIGQALVEFFINRYKDQCEYLQVGTQVANVPSMRLYQKLGFSITNTAYVMHKHVRNDT